MTLFISIKTSAETKYVSSENGLHIRELRSTKSESIKVIGYGEEVEIIEPKSIIGWIKISHEEHIGYVLEEHLQEDDPLEDLIYLGDWRITAYAATGSPCANGNMPSVGYTIACNSLDFGTRVYIQDVGFRVVEDRGPGWLGSEWIDLYLGNAASCVQWGDQVKAVYLVEETEND